MTEGEWLDDGCLHRQTSPGQSMCRCTDRRMFLELLCEMQARRIVELETERQRGEVTYL